MEKKLQKTFPIYSNLLIARGFLASSLSNLVNNFSEEIHRTKCNYGDDDKKCETCGIVFML